MCKERHFTTSSLSASPMVGGRCAEQASLCQGRSRARGHGRAAIGGRDGRAGHSPCSLCKESRALSSNTPHPQTTPTHQTPQTPHTPDPPDPQSQQRLSKGNTPDPEREGDDGGSGGVWSARDSLWNVLGYNGIEAVKELSSRQAQGGQRQEQLCPATLEGEAHVARLAVVGDHQLHLHGNLTLRLRLQTQLG